MKQLLAVFAFLLVTGGCERATERQGLTFYLQVVRGGDQEVPPSADARPVGPRLNEKLHSVLKWKRYWEIHRDSVAVRPGQKVRKRISPEREIEIELLDPRRMSVCVYLNGKPTRKLTQLAEAAFFIAGGDKGPDQSWFIVLRRDRPVEI